MTASGRSHDAPAGLVHIRTLLTNLFPGSDESSVLARETDWAATPLGDPATWSPELTAAIRTTMPSGVPMLLWWGEQLVQVYNDAYRPICGVKHPWAMGQPAAECWPEAWDELGPRVARVVATGEAVHEDALLLLLERHGFVEETYWRYSFSPVRSADGVVLGVFVATTEVSDAVVGEYRLAAVRELALLPTADLGSAAAAARRVTAALARDRRAVPFAAVHLREAGGDLVLAASEGLEDGGTAVPERVRVGSGHLVAEAARSLRAQRAPVEDTGLRATPGPLGPRPPRELVHLPLGGVDGPLEGVLSVGLSPYRPDDGPVEAFLALLARQLTALLTDVRADNLEAALRTNRTIGVAVGVLMSTRQVTADEAFRLLRRTSSTSNRKLREVAEDVVVTGRLPD